MSQPGIHRPRNLDWRRAASLLYGDWGTSKAYVIGLAFVAAAYSSLPIILAVCLLTAVVGYNYIIVCRHFPDGGGVYSAARDQSRVLAVIGALLLVANFAVTAAMSGWAAMSYFGVPADYVRWGTLLVIVIVGMINYFGPKHTGNLAATFALPMVGVVIVIILLSIPDLSTANLAPPEQSFGSQWVAFAGVILALSGVEAVANLTGVMKLNPDATVEKPCVSREATKSILPVAIEVVIGTSLLGWAMLSLPRSLEPRMQERWEDMVRFLAEEYGARRFGEEFGVVLGVVTGIVIGLLLLSAVNTAVSALIGLGYMMSRDGEMPRSFTRLNPHGVPYLPLAIAAIIPFAVAAFAPDLKSLAGLYAIGVVGAITVNLGSCSFNRHLPLKIYERVIMTMTFFLLAAVELTIAYQSRQALFFAVCVVGFGLGLRGYAQKRAGLRTLTVSQELAAQVAPEQMPDWKLNLGSGQSIMVAARGLTPVLRYALEEARFRQGTLYVLYVKELAVVLPGPLENVERPKWQQDHQASRIMLSMIQLGRENGVQVVPLYSVSENPAATILDLAATLGIDILMLGASHRRSLAQMFKGDVANEVAKNLPENIQLVIHG